MRFLRLHYWCAGGLAAWAAGVALPAHAQMNTFGGDPGTNVFLPIPRDTDDWTRHFRLGALVGMNISANFSMKGQFGVANPPGFYDANDYVLADATGDKDYTANWAYSSSSQIKGNDLVMTGASSFSTTGSSQSDGGFQPGLDMAYGGNLWYWRHARVGWDLGFSWLPIDIISHQSFVGTVNQTQYSYDISGLQGQIPSAPYTGAKNGLGPLIPRSPSSTATLASSQGIVSGTHELDVSLYTLRLGPTMFWDLTDRTSISFGVGPAVGLVDGDYKYNEFITANGHSTPNSGKISGDDIVFGGYVNATFLYHLQKNGDIYLSAQYMPMTDAAISGAGREGDLQLNGQLYISLGINWPF